jgi:hypothetical protein
LTWFDSTAVDNRISWLIVWSIEHNLGRHTIAPWTFSARQNLFPPALILASKKVFTANAEFDAVITSVKHSNIREWFSSHLSPFFLAFGFLALALLCRINYS